MTKLLTSAALAALLSAGAAYAVTVPFTVEAGTNSFADDEANGLATGITLTAGELFSVTVTDPLDTWTVGPGGQATVTADGTQPNGNLRPIYDVADLAAPRGTLVGRVGLGDFFAIGTGELNIVADATGELALFQWEFDTNNNTGSIDVEVTYDVGNVSAIPLPAGLPLLGGALLGAYALRRKKQS